MHAPAINSPAVAKASPKSLAKKSAPAQKAMDELSVVERMNLQRRKGKVPVPTENKQQSQSGKKQKQSTSKSVAGAGRTSTETKAI